MYRKEEARREAIRLRKRGMSYSEIVEELGVSKGTLSVWLRDLQLSSRAQARIDRKLSKSCALGGRASRSRWKKIREKIYRDARQEVSTFSFTRDTFAFVGAALYWAEGSKSLSMDFANSDPDMLWLYVQWLRKIIEVPHEDIKCTVSVYLNNGLTIDAIQSYWSDWLGVPLTQFNQPVVDNTPKSSKKKVRNVLVYGTVKVSVRNPMHYAAKLSAFLERMGKPSNFVEFAAEFR